MNFKYKKSLLGHLSPVIPVQLFHGRAAMDYEVFIDSGAEISVFNTELAHTLGINLSRAAKRKITGVTGHSRYCFLYEIQMQVGGWKFPLKVGFMDGMDKSYGIVGQRGFFEAFKIAFDLANESIALTAHA